MKNIAIIPARSGSKGLKDKNIKLLNGEPLLAYTIKAALESELFDEIFVSTDSEKYAKIAQEYGAKVPFLRSKELSTDKASSWSVVKDVVLNYKKMGVEFDILTLLQPTSPLREAKDIINAYHLMIKKKANAIVSVCEVDHSPLWCNTLPEDKSLENFIQKEFLNAPRQSLPVFYRVNGSIYIIKVDFLMTAENIYQANSFAYVMDKKRSIDIDDEFDFNVAREILSEDFPKHRKIGEKQPNAFYNGKKEELKVIILGCDPSTEDQNKKFHTVFNLKSDNGELNLKNPYFNNIYRNLLHILTANSDVKQFDQEEIISNQIYVQNLCRDYLEHVTGYYKDNWAKWINSKTVYIDELKQELDLIDPQRKLPVLLTAEVLIEALINKELIRQQPLEFSNYYNNHCGVISSENNRLGRVLIPFSRSPRYDLAGFQQYCGNIKKVFSQLNV